MSSPPPPNPVTVMSLSFVGGLLGAHLAQGHPLGNRQPSAPSLPPPTFVTPVALLSPPYASRFVFASPAPPCPMIQFFPSMTPPPWYESASPAPSAMDPPPAPRPSSQSTPVAGYLAFLSPQSTVHAPTFIVRLSLSIGRLLARPSARPERRESPSSVFLFRM